jgi:MFS family permease
MQFWARNSDENLLKLNFMANRQAAPIFYGWWIVLAAFLNLFLGVGVIFYGFPVFYASLVESLGFTRAQATQGFLLGFLLVGLPFGFFAGSLIDRIGARRVILVGVACVGASLLLMGFMTRLWQYEGLCVLEVLGYVLAGPIANQVLVARWFRKLRGRAMGYAYLGLGLGGVISPLLVTHLIRAFGWRLAIQMVGILTMIVLFPVGLWITRSSPAEMGLAPDASIDGEDGKQEPASAFTGVGSAVRTANFWLILFGSTLVIGTIGAVIQHFILFLKDLGYSTVSASRFSTVLLASSLCGRVVVGDLADRLSKKNIMAFFYLSIGISTLLLGVSHQVATIWVFAIVFGFSMGADYMLVPLVTAECFGTRSLGKLLALIIMGYSLGQWGAPWMVGSIFDVQHSYALGWKIMGVAGLIGAAAVYCVSTSSRGMQQE